ncbi:hypothetical protein D9M68_563800 [compost metagenome]
MAHHPQAPGRQLQADDEEQQHHAQLGQAGDAFQVGDQAQYGWPDQHPGRQITQYRSQLQALGQRHGENGGEQEHHCRLQQAAVVGHESLLGLGTSGGRHHKAGRAFCWSVGASAHVGRTAWGQRCESSTSLSLATCWAFM